jgi:excinuclease ABC subunit C
VQQDQQATGDSLTARATARRLPQEPGVYRFRDAAGRVLYIGRAGNLRRRVQSYWTHLGDRPRLAVMVRRIARIEAVWCDSEHEAAWLERNLLEHSMPRWNRAEGGLGVMGYIRFDAGAVRPELRFVHAVTEPAPRDTVSHWGPYLGGTRIRQAISALHRVLPLAYAGTVDGFSREFARLFGIGPDDREALAGLARAALAREPAAVRLVREELVRRRDLAAGQQRYEFAGKLTEELAAFDWIVAEQKVTRQEAGDVEVCGWFDGVLVRFEQRAGRLCVWSQREVGEPSARPRIAATPASWREFARRNAELAVRLRSP